MDFPARPLLAAILLSIVAFPATTKAREEREPLEVLESGWVTADLSGVQATISYSRTAFGPLVTLAPIVAALSGDLSVGPVEERHELLLGGESFLLGPGSSAVTTGEEIYELSQPSEIGLEGIQVPLDLLEQTYGRVLGYEFAWQPAGPTLVVTRRPARRVPLVFDVVHLQGVTTLVFQFPIQPRYRIQRNPARIEVEMIGDRLEVGPHRPFPADDLVRDVQFTPERIFIDLAPNTRAQDYELDQPFRLVLDVLRDSGQRQSSVALPNSRRERTAGIRTVVLDPGHGGTDTGAEGPSGTYEKNVTLLLARSLKARLEAKLPVKVVLTRNEDTLLPLDTRPAIANQHKADLFISLHLNSAPVRGANGAETYFSSLEASDERAAEAASRENRGDPLQDLQLILWDLAQSRHMVESQRFAGLIQAELNETLQLRNRGVKQAPFRVLLGAAMPAVLVELGFLTNSEEESKLTDPEYRGRLVDALTRATTRYKAQVENLPVTEEDVAGL